MIDVRLAEEAVQFVAERVGVKLRDMQPAAGLGVYRDGTLVVGLAFNNYCKLPHGAVCDVAIASDDPGIWTRGLLRRIFEYPFQVLELVRLQAMVAVTNERSLRFVRGLGFVEEGVARRMADGETDAVLLSMLPSECSWLARS